MKSAGSVSYSDILTAIGVALLAGAVWCAVGWVGVLAYAGVIFIIIGLALARKEGG